MTQTEALTLALEALEKLTDAAEGFSVSGVYFNEELQNRKCLDDAYDAIGFAQEALSSPNAEAQPEQEPVAMKFKIYKPTVPDPTRQDINNALLPWVYDQDRSSGFDASMWVTPVSTLPPQRKPLTDEEIGAILEGVNAYGTRLYTFARAIEAVHGIGEQK